MWFHAINTSEWFQLWVSFGCNSYHEYPEAESTSGLHCSGNLLLLNVGENEKSDVFLHITGTTGLTPNTTVLLNETSVMD